MYAKISSDIHRHHHYRFDREELVWPEVKPQAAAEEILRLDGMFKFSKVKDQLGLQTMELTKLSKMACEAGLDTYETYGFGKPKGSQYILKMSKFRETYSQLYQNKVIPTNISPELIQTIPGEIHNANSVIKLKGFFRLNDVCRFSPFSENSEVIKNLVRKAGSQEEAMTRNGSWYDNTKREFFIRMEKFVPWFFQEIWMAD